MKYFLLPVIVLITVVVFASAKEKQKTKDNYIPQLSGSWGGAYTMDKGPMVNDISFDFIGSALLVIDGERSWGDEAKGRYAIKGDSITGKFTYKQGIQEPVSFKGRINNGRNELEGTWEGFRGRGIFHMKRRS